MSFRACGGRRRGSSGPCIESRSSGLQPGEDHSRASGVVEPHAARRSEASGATRSFIIGGEALFGEQLSFWREHAAKTRLINEYGPTETVVGCCVYECGSDSELGSGAVPIGRPIANTRLYVLDGSLRPTPLGVAGELYIWREMVWVAGI